MLERLSWKQLVWGLILFCLPAFILAIFVGHLAWLLVISLLAALIWHSYNLLKLSYWLWLDRSMIAPEGKGAGSQYSMELISYSGVIVNVVAN